MTITETLTETALELEHRYYLVTMTPALATEILSFNVQNRKLQPSRVEMYARDMRRGAWRLNPQPIVISDTTLWDGQHRLQAVVKSGLSIDMLLVTTTDELWTDVLTVVDTGKARSLNDVLFMSGVNRPSLISAIVKQTMTLRLLFRDLVDDADQIPVASGNGLATRSEQLEYFDSNKDLLAAVAEIAHHRGGVVGVSKEMWGGHEMFIRRYLDDDLGTAFMVRLLEGHDDRGGFFKLREYLINQQSQLRAVAPRQLTHVLVKLWNAWIEGSVDEVKLIKFTPDHQPTFRRPPADT